MKRATSVTIATSLMLSALISTPLKGTAQNSSGFEMQDGRRQIESSTTPQGCSWNPRRGWQC
jgi:hypothetical protein